MIHLSHLLTFALSIAPYLGVIAQANSPCPLLGADVPVPTNPSTSNAVNAAIKSMKHLLQSASTKATTFGQMDFANTSFSLDVYSIHEGQSMFTYHHSAPALSKPAHGVSSVDSNTIYRVGSVSKLWTMYTFLLAVGDSSFMDPITKYVPELAALASQNAPSLASDRIDIVDWNEITVGALASHLGGIGRDPGDGPVFDKAFSQQTGLPLPQEPNGTFCGNPANIILVPCNRASYLSDFLVRHPVSAPFSLSTYSNAGYVLLSYALEKITSQAYPDIFASSFVSPLKLNATSYSAPSSTNSSVIPPGSYSWYSYNIGEYTVTGGYYSTINDMRKVGVSILNSTVLNPAQTRRWMKPHSFTSNPNVSVGAPWEIRRAPSSRVGYMYTKNGEIPYYTAQVALMPDFDVGFSVLAASTITANSVQNVEILSDMIAQIFVPALEAAAKEEAHKNYAGTYTSKALNGSLTIASDNLPGLDITSFELNGTDIFPLAASLALEPGASNGPERVALRLYPIGLKSTRDGETTRTGWRLVTQILPEALDPGAFSMNCAEWVNVDGTVYGITGFDEFLFNLGDDGEATSIQPRILEDAPFARMK